MQISPEVLLSILLNKEMEIIVLRQKVQTLEETIASLPKPEIEPEAKT